MMPKPAYFLADLHLGAQYDNTSRASEREVVAFLDSIKENVSEIILLGDILDYWYEYKYVVPKGYVRFFGKLAELTDSGVKISWIIGNHDIWIYDYLPMELGINVIDGILERNILNKRFLLQHGDGLETNRRFRFIRKLFRNRFCQRLYSAIHPRWTVKFAYDWSRHSRGSQDNSALEERMQLTVNNLKSWCENRINDGDQSDYFVFGHLHRGIDMKLSNGKEMIILPPWMGERGYGVFDGEKFDIKFM